MSGRKAPFEVKQEWQVTPNQEIIAVRYRFEPADKAGFSYNSRGKSGATEYSEDFDLLDNNTKVVCYRKCTFHGTQTVYHDIDYRTKEKAFVDKPAVRHSLTFEAPLVIDLDPSNSQRAYKIAGALFTGQKISLDHTTANRPVGPIRLIGSAEAGNRWRLTFSLEKP